MPEPATNKIKARWQLGVILVFEAVLSAAAIWIGFVTNNWMPVIAVLACAAIVTVLMMVSVMKNTPSAEE